MPFQPQTFRPPHHRSRAEQKAEADKRRGSARGRGYTTAWDRAAADFRNAHPLCLGCQAVGRIAAATVTDHVVPHKGDDALFWDEGNWQAACGWHHDVIKQRLEAAWAAGRLRRVDLRLDSSAAIALANSFPTQGGG